MRRTAPTSIHDLLEHREFVRRLARRMVREQALSDDIEQQTWLTVLERPPRHDAGLRAWLSLVVRNVAIRSFRAEGRRVLRERRAWSERDDGEVDEDLGFEALRGALATELAALEPIYRDVLRSRYDDGLSTQAIAEQLAIPQETVRTRLKRGLAQLRERLDRRGTGGACASGAFAFGVRRPRPGGGPRGLVCRQRFAAVAGVAAVLVAVPFATLPRTESPDVVPVVRDVGAAPAPRASLAVAAPAARTAEHMPPVAALMLPPKLDAAPMVATGPIVAGRVLDLRNRPIAGAEILVSRPGRPLVTEVACTTGADGSFLLKDIDPRCWIGARRGDGEHSLLRSLLEPHNASLTLGLRKQPLARGRVVDADGEPVAGAQVTRGRSSTGMHTRLDGALLLEPLVSTLSDADGRFALPAPGAWLDLVVAAPGHARTHDTFSLSGDAPIVVALDAGRSLQGIAYGPDRATVAGAQIIVRAAGGGEEVSTLSGPDGSYHVAGLGFGAYTLVARARGLRDSTRLAASRSPVHRWDAYLAYGSAVRGVAIDASGAPLAGWWVALCAQTDADRAAVRRLAVDEAEVRWESTDADGEFRFDGCADDHFDVTLVPRRAEEEPAHALASGQEPGGAPIALRLRPGERGTAHLRGRLGGVAGRPVTAAVVFVDAPGALRPRRVELDATGRFELDRLVGGSYGISVWSTGGPPTLLTQVELEAGEVLDLGSLAPAAPGALELAVRCSSGAPTRQLSVGMRSSDGAGYAFVGRPTRPGRGVEFPEPGLVSVPRLPAGAYSLWIDCRGHARAARDVVVRPGATTRLEIDLELGWPRRFEIGLPERPVGPGAQEVWTRVLDEHGGIAATARRSFVPGAQGGIAFERTLAVGAYSAVTTFEHRGRIVAESRVAFEVQPRTAALIRFDL
ncbi:MAG: sigma-70 family RNA polymerase sigma factor [bacterium]|nr:sigma-70 family RNA polymerase sigma factor [bacterium]